MTLILLYDTLLLYNLGEFVLESCRHQTNWGYKKDIVSLAHNVSFWAQKLTHSVSQFLDQVTDP